MDSDKPRSDDQGEQQRNTWVSGAGRTLGRMARQAAVEIDELTRHAKKALSLGIEERKPSRHRVVKPARIEALIERLGAMIQALDADRVSSLQEDPAFWSLVNQLHQARVHKSVTVRRSQPPTKPSVTAPNDAEGERKSGASDQEVPAHTDARAEADAGVRDPDHTPGGNAAATTEGEVDDESEVAVSATVDATDSESDLNPATTKPAETVAEASSADAPSSAPDAGPGEAEESLEEADEAST